jgi:hypothetical protein
METYQIFVYFQKACDSIQREKRYAIMMYCGILSKMIRLTQVTMKNSTYHVKIGTIMMDSFQKGTGSKQGDGLAPNLFNIALEYVIRNFSVQTTLILVHKSVKLIVYADDINIIRRTKMATSGVYGKLKERSKEAGLIINVGKTKEMVQSREEL